MKRAGFLVVVICLLAGCGSNNKEIERAMALRTSLLQSQGCAFDADITADYGDFIHQFRVSCQGDSQGNLTFSVVSPESISGITGTITEAGGKLTFDATALAFDSMAEGQVTPAMSPWVLLRTLRSGCLTSAGMEGDLLMLSIDDSYKDDALHLDIWIDSENSPVRAEILYAGKRILSLDVKNFQIT